ncbi:sulfurtransferase [Glaciibacter flavus]|uniref:sulfurtransferase n=1 Tax=Orlajensenia flava TaxID=2565934 RepID=UPI003B00E80F
MPEQLISVEELAAAAASGRRVHVLDVRWRLGRDDGRELYLAGHVPGAVFVDLPRELAAEASASEGRHPLPAIDDLQASARRWGLNDGDGVVVYDGNGGQSAARAWWLLRHAGMTDVRLLDGGIDAWRRAGLGAQTDDVDARPGTVTLAYGHLPVLDADAAARLPEDGGVLLDARAAERYRGEVEPVDSRAGHIPGALSAPSSGNLDESGDFRSADALREHFEHLGVSADAPVGVYCGSGVTAAHDVLALAVAGYDAALYPGSWSQWSNDPSRPVATGGADETPPKQS